MFPPEQWERALRDLETYRRQLPRLLQEGHAGRYALVKDDQVVSTWDDQEEKLNRLLQELAWGAVVQHPLSDVGLDAQP